jgi:hypothetical protein
MGQDDAWRFLEQFGNRLADDQDEVKSHGVEIKPAARKSRSTHRKTYRRRKIRRT